jgi:hypothetical protein
MKCKLYYNKQHGKDDYVYDPLFFPNTYIVMALVVGSSKEVRTMTKHE